MPARVLIAGSYSRELLALSPAIRYPMPPRKLSTTAAAPKAAKAKPVTKSGRITKLTAKSGRVINTAKSSLGALDTQPPSENNPERPVPSKPPKYQPNEQNHRYWLIKTEPVNRIDPKSKVDISFSLESLMKVEKEPWNGVRNWEARNNLLHMQKGDICLVYHSNCKNPGIVGVAKVAEEAHPDAGQFSLNDPYFDAKSTLAKPRWWCPDMSFHRRLRRKLSLVELRKAADSTENLKDFMLVRRGRLSVIPVSVEQFEELMKLEQIGEIDNDDNLDCSISQEFIASPKRED